MAAEMIYHPLLLILLINFVCLFMWWAGISSLPESLPGLVTQEGRSLWGSKRPAFKASRWYTTKVSRVATPKLLPILNNGYWKKKQGLGTKTMMLLDMSHPGPETFQLINTPQVIASWLHKLLAASFPPKVHLLPGSLHQRVGSVLTDYI